MSRVLVLGGYGGFGGRIVDLLARDGHEVLVGGRNLERAGAFCEARAGRGLRPVVVDRMGDLAGVLRSAAPWLVIDAAGPFQGADYAVPRACVAAGAHYLDIADGRAFVSGIGALDAEAVGAGVAAVSGASSVPALSSAVVDALADGLDRVTLVEAAITAGDRATAGRSVIEAILSYVGRPVELLQAGRRRRGRGWQPLVRLRLSIPGGPPLPTRLVGLCDVPDLELLSERYPGRPSVVFRAGAERGWANRALWLLSWPVRWGWVPSLRPLAPLIERMRRWTRRFGGDRSGMEVRVLGLEGDRRVERRWTLIAERGDGPWTPCLAAPLLARRLAAGELAPGARPAVGLLSLAAFEAAFAGLAFRTGREEVTPAPPLFARVMGEAFARLPPTVRALHGGLGAAVAEGRADVERGTHPLARLAAHAIGFPPAAADGPLTVWCTEADGVETWERDFGTSGGGGGRFRSRLSARGGRLVERFGPLAFAFALEPLPDGLAMRLRGWSLGPLPLPLALAPRTEATEREVDGRFRFDVAIRLPLVGLVVRYRGELRPL